MAMPETAVDENNLAKTLEDKVRSARQIAPMEPVSVSFSMHDLWTLISGRVSTFLMLAIRSVSVRVGPVFSHRTYLP